VLAQLGDHVLANKPVHLLVAVQDQRQRPKQASAVAVHVDSLQAARSQGAVDAIPAGAAVQPEVEVQSAAAEAAAVAGGTAGGEPRANRGGDDVVVVVRAHVVGDDVVCGGDGVLDCDREFLNGTQRLCYVENPSVASCQELLKSWSTHLCAACLTIQAQCQVVSHKTPNRTPVHGR
jgi:hypothetical protein